MVSLFDVKEVYLNTDLKDINEKLKSGDWILLDTADGKTLDGDPFVLIAIGRIR